MAVSSNVLAASSNFGNASKFGIDASSMDAPAESASARYSRSLPGLEEATVRWRCLLCADTEIRLHQSGLIFGEAANSGRRQRQQILQFGAAKRLPFGRRLDFDEPAVSGHHEIHVHFSAGILIVGQVQKRRALYQ